MCSISLVFTDTISPPFLTSGGNTGTKEVHMMEHHGTGRKGECGR